MNLKEELEIALEILSKAVEDSKKSPAPVVSTKQWTPKDPTLHEGEAIKSIADKGFSLREAAHISGAEKFSNPKGVSFPEMSEPMLSIAKGHASEKIKDHDSKQPILAENNPHKTIAARAKDATKDTPKVDVKGHLNEHKLNNATTGNEDLDDLGGAHNLYSSKKKDISDELAHGITSLKGLTNEVEDKRRDKVAEIRLGYLGDASETQEKPDEDLEDFLDSQDPPQQERRPEGRRPGGHQAPSLPNRPSQQIMSQDESIKHGGKEYTDHLVNTIADGHIKHLERSGKIPEGMDSADLVSGGYIGGLRGITTHGSNEHNLYRNIAYGAANEISKKIRDHIGQSVISYDAKKAGQKTKDSEGAKDISTSQADESRVKDIVGGGDEAGTQSGSVKMSLGRKFALENPEIAQRAIEKAKKLRGIS